MCSSLKTVIGILLIIIAVLCTLNAFIFASIVSPVYEFTQLWLQMSYIGTAWLCLLFGISTWFKQSVEYQPRQHLRILMIVTLLGLLIADLVTFIFYNSAMESMGDHNVMEDIFTGAEMVFPTVTLVLCVIIIILFVITIIMLIYLVVKRYKEHN